ncbi:carbohydrate kinase family protein [Nakamurella silvestris]|nr:carbohydrate kinase family protein [Nakamurella silvestris]
MSAAQTAGRPWDILAIGDASVDTYTRVPFFPGPDQKAIGTMLGVFGGGMCANFAAAAARAGARTRLMTSVGSDQAGRDFLAEVATHGVDAAPSLVIDNAHTFACFVQLDDTGEKSLIGCDTGIKIPPADAVTDDLLAQAGWVYPLPDDIGWAAEIAERSVRAGAAVVLDLERSAFTDGAQPVLDLVSRSDIVCTNAGVAEQLGVTSPAEIAGLLAGRGARIVLVTDGGRGSWVLADGVLRHAEAPTVPVVDTTGAGDAFNGTFVGRIATGSSVDEAMLAAVAAASRCVQHLGSRTFHTDAPEVDPMIRLTRH